MNWPSGKPMWKRIGPRLFDIAPISEQGEFIRIEEVCLGVAQNTAEPGEVVHAVKWDDMNRLVYDVQSSSPEDTGAPPPESGN